MIHSNSDEDNQGCLVEQELPPETYNLYDHSRHASCQCKDKGFPSSIPAKKRYRSRSIMRMMSFIKEEEDKRQKSMQKKRDLYAKYHIERKGKKAFNVTQSQQSYMPTQT